MNPPTTQANKYTSSKEALKKKRFRQIFSLIAVSLLIYLFDSVLCSSFRVVLIDMWLICSSSAVMFLFFNSATYGIIPDYYDLNFQLLNRN